MNIKAAAQVIRDEVDMDRILGLYGYRTKKGFMCCPFHGEKQPSLKVYKTTGGWHCFGCGRGGSVIDFVMAHEQCSFSTAVRAIDSALHLHLMDPKEDAFDASAEKRKQEWLDRVVEAVNAYLDTLTEMVEKGQKTRLAMVKVLEEKRDRDKQSVTADEWTEILKWPEEEQYDEYRKEKIEEFREEVAAWRRKARRTG